MKYYVLPHSKKQSSTLEAAYAATRKRIVHYNVDVKDVNGDMGFCLLRRPLSKQANAEAILASRK